MEDEPGGYRLIVGMKKDSHRRVPSDLSFRFCPTRIAIREWGL